MNKFYKLNTSLACLSIPAYLSLSLLAKLKHFGSELGSDSNSHRDITVSVKFETTVLCVIVELDKQISQL